jgi:hypothetical protein
LGVIGRLQPGLSLARAQANVDVTFRQFLQSQLDVVPSAQLATVPHDLQQRFLDQRIVLTGGSRGGSLLRKDYTKPLVVLMALVGLLLLSACANLANLMLARAARRQKEIALRVALGAKTFRVFRQLLTESLLLAFTGGGLGLLLAYWSDSLLLRLVTKSPAMVHTDGRVLLFALGVSIFVGAVFGAAPAAQAWRLNLNGALKGTGEKSGRTRWFPLGKALVVVQVALSLPLLVVSGLFVHSLQRLSAVDPGYDQAHLVLLQADSGGREGASLAQFYRDLTENLRVRPGVHAATISANGHFTGRETSYRIAIEGYEPPPGQNMGPSFDHVGPG